jgi:hypothetical protein
MLIAVGVYLTPDVTLMLQLNTIKYVVSVLTETMTLPPLPFSRQKTT